MSHASAGGLTRGVRPSLNGADLLVIRCADWVHGPGELAEFVGDFCYRITEPTERPLCPSSGGGARFGGLLCPLKLVCEVQIGGTRSSSGDSHRAEGGHREAGTTTHRLKPASGIAQPPRHGAEFWVYRVKRPSKAAHYGTRLARFACDRIHMVCTAAHVVEGP